MRILPPLLFTLGSVSLGMAMRKDAHWGWRYLAVAGYAGAMLCLALERLL